ncbi:hypothetical protein [Streptococcus pneumoniae]|uniref:hypothetical protein n=1 Tax=Streptococcus pneumoniae TaxID=1313 RepID=UPI000AD4C97E|nr:hypothetical protein [Streptococcus pneumoniae]
MKIKVQTRKLAAGCSKHCFKVVGGTDVVSSNTVLRWWVELTKSAQNTVLRLWMEADEVSSKHGFEVVDES